MGPVLEPAHEALMQEIAPACGRCRDGAAEPRPQADQRRRQDGAPAMLTAPTYLTGVNEELLRDILDEAAKRHHPERHAKLEAVR